MPRPKRQSDVQICNMKVAELRRIAISHGIPIKDDNGKFKLKCELLVELADVIDLPEFQYDNSGGRIQFIPY